MPTEHDAIYRQLLAVRCRRGDPRAFADVVAHYQLPLLYYLRRILNDESLAWDCLQETWLSSLRGLRRLHNPESLSPFLYRAAHNHALAHLRKHRAADALLQAIPLPPDHGPEPTFTPDDAAAIEIALVQLPPWQREVLTLFFLDELPVADMAAVLDIPPGTVKSRLHYAKRQLRAALEKMGYRHDQ